MYLASQDDNAAQVCFIDLQVIAHPETANTESLVDFREFLQPTQSE